MTLRIIVAAAITAGLVQVGLHYFRGNLLGFIGLCALIVLVVYCAAGAAAYCNRRRTGTIRRY